MAAGAAFVAVAVRFVTRFVLIAGTVGFAGSGGGGALMDCTCVENRDLIDFACCAFKTDRNIVSSRKMTVAYFVILVSALPLPAPKSASVAAPPKAWPMPASFLGNCTNTSRISNKQSITSSAVSNPIIQIINA